MANQVAEIRKHLKKHGWNLLREGTRHAIFLKNGNAITIPRGTSVSRRNYKQILWQIEGKACSKWYNPVTLPDEAASQPALKNRSF